MEETLQHKKTTQCIGVSPTGTRSRNNHGSEADHALTINLAQSDEAAQQPVMMRAISMTSVVMISVMMQPVVREHLSLPRERGMT